MAKQSLQHDIALKVRYLFCMLVIAAVSSSVQAQDSDSDGLLDLIDSPRFDTSAIETLNAASAGIEDLDGASQLSPEVIVLNLGANQIASVEAGDFAGLSVEHLYLFNNQITNIEPRAFAGLNLRDLNLNGNNYSDLHLEGVLFENLFHLGIDRFDVTRLFLDDATLSVSGYNEVVNETTEITDLSIVGLRFFDERPESLSTLLGFSNLENVTVDQELFDLYANDFNSFAQMDGNTLSVVAVNDLDGDCSQDGMLGPTDLSCVSTIAERDVVLSAFGALPGDLDGDGRVTFDDFRQLARNFGKNPSTYAEGNIDLVGGVAFDDFRILAANFAGVASSSSSAAASGEPVPEPDALVLLLLGLPLIFRCRARSVLRKR